LMKDEACFTTVPAFQRDKKKDRDEDEPGKAFGGFDLIETEPGAEKSHGESAEAEVLDRAVVVKDFHRDEEESGDERGAGEGELDGPENHPRGAPKHSSGFAQDDATTGKGAASRQKNVGVEDGGEEENEAAISEAFFPEEISIDTLLGPNLDEEGDEFFASLGGKVGRDEGRDGEGQDEGD